MPPGVENPPRCLFVELCASCAINSGSVPQRGACHFVHLSRTLDVVEKRIVAQAGKQSKAKGPAGSFESFQKFVKQKTEQLRKDYGSVAVEYAVEVENGQVRLKAKAKS